MSDVSVADVGFSARGVAAEHLLTGLLLDRGHKVAIPVVDDDGVDLIVNYKTLVQVKSSGYRDEHGTLICELRNKNSNSLSSLRPHIDVVAVYGRNTGMWWFVPAAEVTSNRLRLRHDSPFCEKWQVF